MNSYGNFTLYPLTAAAICEKIEKNKFLGTIASIFWPLVAGFYLFISFFTNAWSKTWIIWPICGILFGVFSAIYSAISENKNKN